MIDDIYKIELMYCKCEDTQIFQVGKNSVKYIEIEEKSKKIRIIFEKDSTWNEEIIPFFSIKSLKYKFF